MRISGDSDGNEVYLDGAYLNPAKSQKVYNHSPDGFNWGYGGSGPAQLALAVMLEVTDQLTAKRVYQQFKWDFIAKLPQGKDFVLNIDIQEWIKKTAVWAKEISEKHKRFVIVNVNLEYELPDDCITEDQAIEFAGNVELPKEYVSGSFEFVKIYDEEEGV